jgi:hypothetical protein
MYEILDGHHRVDVLRDLARPVSKKLQHVHALPGGGDGR